MNRRLFLKQSVLAGSAMLGPGLILPGCGRDMRARLMGPGQYKNGGGRPEAEERQILFYASLAPSGHNSQPWRVRAESPGEWVVGWDRDRLLPVVDPDNREVLLSIGAFAENLVQASRSFGYEPEVEVLATERFDPDVIRIRLEPGKTDRPDRACLERMAARRTIKTGMKGDRLTSSDLGSLEQAVGGRLYYFPRGSDHSDAMAGAAVENFRVQFDNMAAMEEAALWTRLSDKEASQFRDGLTTDGMEINGVTGWWVRHFMESRDVTEPLWRKKALEKVMAQVREGAGWLVITSPSVGVADLIEAGRRFERLALAAVPLGIGIHPMTQTLEERQGQHTIRTHHGADMIPQFMLRVGYVATYPSPVSLRRPVDWFFTGST